MLSPNRHKAGSPGRKMGAAAAEGQQPPPPPLQQQHLPVAWASGAVLDAAAASRSSCNVVAPASCQQLRRLVLSPPANLLPAWV
jgi:hypothetical protein